MSLEVEVALKGKGKKFAEGDRVQLGNAKVFGEIVSIDEPDDDGKKPGKTTLTVDVDEIEKGQGGITVKKVKEKKVSE